MSSGAQLLILIPIAALAYYQFLTIKAIKSPQPFQGMPQRYADSDKVTERSWGPKYHKPGRI